MKWDYPIKNKMGDRKIEMTLFFIDIPNVFYENARRSIV